MLTHHRKWLVMGLCIVCGLFVLGPADSPQPWEEEVPWSAFERLTDGAHHATAAEVAAWLPRVDPHGQLGALIELEDNELVFTAVRSQTRLKSCSP